MGGRKRTRGVPLSDRYSEFLTNINNAIKDKGYSQKEVGLYLDLTPSAISKILSGNARISLELYLKLLDFLNLSDELYSEDTCDKILLVSKKEGSSKIFLQATKENLNKELKNLGPGVLLKDTVTGEFLFKGEPVSFLSVKEIDSASLF